MIDLNLTASELAQRLGGKVVGNGDVVITGIAPLSSACAGDVTFLADARLADELSDTQACAVIVAREHLQAKTTLICVDNVMAAVSEVLTMLAPTEDLPPVGVHPKADIAKDAELGEGVSVGPGAVVGGGAKIADGVVLCANVTVGAGAVIGEKTVLQTGTVIISGCRIGRRCRIGPNAVIGSVGFGYYFAEGVHNRIPHVGTVEIGDDVDIGACSCIDRGKFEATRIGDGTKIDNLVQVAHNVRIGRGCLLAGQVGVAGSSVLKDYVALGGQVGISDNITLGTGVRAAAQTGIIRDVPDGMEVIGYPADQARKQLRVWKITSELPEMREKVRKLEKRLAELESANH